jgi:hypothetical protein
MSDGRTFWLAFSEEHRDEVLLDATVQFRVLLRQVLDEERPGQNNMWPEIDLYHEALGRIFRMCGRRPFL